MQAAGAFARASGAWLLGAALMTGCAGEEESASPPSDEDEDDVVLFEPPRFELPGWHEDNRERRFAAGDDWRGEALHDLARPTLAELFEILAAGGDGIDAELLGIVGELSASELRPETLETVFQDASLRVLRGSTGEAQHTRAGLVSLWRTLVSPFDAAPEVHFKIVHVEEVGEDGFETTLLFHLDGRGPEGPIQQNARWRVGWRILGDDENVRVRSLDLLDFEEVHARGELFADLTGNIFGGLSCFRRELLRGVPEYHYRTDFLIGNTLVGMHGVAVGDVDGDGQDDIYLPQQGGLPNRLFVRDTDGGVVDVSRRSGLNFIDGTRSALILDLDDDGRQDVVLAVGAALLIAYNDGDWPFSEFVSLRAPGTSEFYSLCAADADGDGDLDLYGCRYSSRDNLSTVPVPYHDANNGAKNVLWRNEGNREFVDVTAAVGLDENNERFSYAAIWEDFDQDGDPDLYVANDFGRNNLYDNDGGRFTDVAGDVGAEDKSSGMGVSVADYDLDGDMDLYVSNMFSSAGSRIVPQYRFRGEAPAAMLDEHLLFSRGNTLLANRGDGTFEDVTLDSRATVGGWAWGALFVDFNNDGREDLYSPNGYITNDDPEDT